MVVVSAVCRIISSPHLRYMLHGIARKENSEFSAPLPLPTLLMLRLLHRLREYALC